MRRKLKDYPEISLRTDDLTAPVDFARLFASPGPVHVEIGCGKGSFLVNQAKADPGLSFLGIEWSNKYYRHTVDRLGRHGLQNVRIVRADAAEFIRKFIPDASVTCFHIYFPDPWPKRRHHKRRLFCPSSVAQMLRCLKPAGIVQFATDYAEYFQAVIELMAGFADELAPTDFVRPAGTRDGEWTGTNFERKYLRQGKQIFAGAWKKL